MLKDFRFKTSRKVSCRRGLSHKELSSLHPGLTGHLYSPFEEMDPSVSLQHSESERSKSQKGWVARYILNT